MAFGVERARLDEGALRIVTWHHGPEQYQALLYAGPTGAPLITLSHLDAEEIRAFARVLETIAEETEHQYDEEDRS
jgi:hypothetical protein